MHVVTIFIYKEQSKRSQKFKFHEGHHFTSCWFYRTHTGQRDQTQGILSGKYMDLVFRSNYRRQTVVCTGQCGLISYFRREFLTVRNSYLRKENFWSLNKKADKLLHFTDKSRHSHNKFDFWTLLHFSIVILFHLTLRVHTEFSKPKTLVN